MLAQAVQIKTKPLCSWLEVSSPPLVAPPLTPCYASGAIAAACSHLAFPPTCPLANWYQNQHPEFSRYPVAFFNMQRDTTEYWIKDIGEDYTDKSIRAITKNNAGTFFIDVNSSELASLPINQIGKTVRWAKLDSIAPP